MSIKSIRARQEALQAEIKALGQEGLMTEFRQFFNDNPEVTGLAWTQYAPYFNDGDACIFSVHEVHYTTANDPKEAFYEFRGWSEEEDANAGFVDIPWSESARTALHGRIQKFWSEIKDDDIFQTILGDDCKVLVTPLGITTKEHSHD